VELLEAEPKQLDIVFISSPDGRFAVTNSFRIPELARECCEILYHDVAHTIAHMDPPRKHHVEKALDFAKGRDKLIVACQAGISRSSATAYVIKASEVGIVEALTVLNPKIHNPNIAVIKHGAEILNLPDMVPLIRAWKDKADEAQWDTGPTLHDYHSL
jgi:predicted protein tyrosine phosphatase